MARKSNEQMFLEAYNKLTPEQQAIIAKLVIDLAKLHRAANGDT